MLSLHAKIFYLLTERLLGENSKNWNATEKNKQKNTKQHKQTKADDSVNRIIKDVRSKVKGDNAKQDH